MLGAINNISILKEALAKAEVTRFNSNLPISIKVLRKMDGLFYKLQLGNKEFDTRSLKQLDIGAKYWGDFNKSKEGIINISNLLKKPNILQKNQLFLQFNEKALTELLSSKDPRGIYKSLLLDQLSKAGSKAEFVQLSNMLLAFQEGVVTIPYRENSIESILQYKKNKQEQRESEDSLSIDFYAAFDNLGPIDGTLYMYDDMVSGVINCQYKKTQMLLENIKEELSFEVVIGMKEQIKPLHELDNSLLNLKG